MSQYLYRLFNDKDELLYIGISKSAIHRLHQHLETQPWGHEIAYQKIERYSDRRLVEEAERKAIKAENPKYNVVFNNERPLQEVSFAKSTKEPRRGYGKGTIRQLNSGRWQARYRDGGKYQSAPIVFDTKEEAKEWLEGVDRERADKYDVMRIGDCVALGFADGKCVVGQIEALWNGWIRVTEKNFFTGYYDGPSKAHRLDDVVEMVFAQELYDPHDHRTVNDEALGDFQTAWKQKHGFDQISPEWEETLRKWGEIK